MWVGGLSKEITLEKERYLRNSIVVVKWFVSVFTDLESLPFLKGLLEGWSKQNVHHNDHNDNNDGHGCRRWIGMSGHSVHDNTRD